LTIQFIGQGFFTPFYLFNPHYLNSVAAHSMDSSLNSPDPIYKQAIHNGLLVSPLGTFTDQVNGVSISAFMSKGTKIIGAFNLCNFAIGLQITALWCNFTS
jgi:hypothetical protein